MTLSWAVTSSQASIETLRPPVAVVPCHRLPRDLIWPRPRARASPLRILWLAILMPVAWTHAQPPPPTSSSLYMCTISTPSNRAYRSNTPTLRGLQTQEQRSTMARRLGLTTCPSSRLLALLTCLLALFVPSALADAPASSRGFRAPLGLPPCWHAHAAAFFVPAFTCLSLSASLLPLLLHISDDVRLLLVL